MGNVPHALPGHLRALGLIFFLPAAVAAPTAAMAQQFLPYPTAELAAPRMSAGLVVTDLLRSDRFDGVASLTPRDRASDSQGAVSLGGQFALLALPGGITAGIETAVIARFRLETHGLEHLTADWKVGVPVEVQRGRWSLRATVVHESSHLGDEAVLAYGIEARDVTHELLNLRAGYQLPLRKGAVLRAHVFTEKLLRSVWDDGSAERGVAVEWSGALAGAFGTEAGCQFTQLAAEENDERLSCVAGIHQSWTIRPMSVLLVYSTGAALPGDFVGYRERVVGLEFRIH